MNTMQTSVQTVVLILAGMLLAACGSSDDEVARPAETAAPGPGASMMGGAPPMTQTREDYMKNILDLCISKAPVEEAQCGCLIKHSAALGDRQLQYVIADLENNNKARSDLAKEMGSRNRDEAAGFIPKVQSRCKPRQQGDTPAT